MFQTLGSLGLRTRPEFPGRTWFWTGIGLLGLWLLIGVSLQDSAGLLERDPNWWTSLPNLGQHLLLLLPGLLGQGVLLLAWWQLGPAVKRPLMVLAGWCLALLLVPPLYSRDAYSYAAQGWLMARGLDPYQVPSGLAGEPGLLVSVYWDQSTSVYPPLSLEIFGWISNLAHSQLYWTAVAMRLPNLVALAVLAWCLPKLAARVGISRQAVLWAGLLNPVMLIQWVGDIHNDAVMVALVALAFLAAQLTAWRGYLGMLCGGALIGLAMGVKQSAAVAGVAVVALAWAAVCPKLSNERRNWPALIRRCLVAASLAVAVFVAISLGSGLGFGWRNPSAGNPLGAISNAPISWLTSALNMLGWVPQSVLVGPVTVAMTALVAAATSWWVLRFGPKPPDSVGQPWWLAVLVLLSVALLGPALQPWYLTWAMPFVILALPSLKWQHGWLVLVWLTAMLPVLQDTMPPPLATALLVLPGLRLWHWVRARQLPVFPNPQTSV